jgi:hypothetical protein
VSIARACRRLPALALSAGFLLAPGSPLAADGVGRMTISPARVAAGSTNTFTLTFAADTGPLTGLTLLDIPRGWTAPQTANPNGAGYVSVSADTCARSTRLSHLAFRRLVIVTSCAAGQSFRVTYANATAATLASDGYLFLTQTRPNARSLPRPKPGRKGRKKKVVKPAPLRFLPLAASKQAYVVVGGNVFDHLVVQATSVAIAGTPFGVTVRAVDAFGNNASAYTRTVTLASSDPAAVLPQAPYRFTTADQGGHTFNGVILRTPGVQSIVARDDAGRTGVSNAIAVYPATSG